jgi:hypothetical protein
MSTLPTNLRRQLEAVITQARTIAEGGARKALEALAVHEPDPYRYMDEWQRGLRRKLRAQAKQLGDGESQTKRGAYEIKHLVEKLAYDQWHRILFARFLLENNLLISPEHQVSVTLDDCEELAPALGLKDAWFVAARFAAKELPEIFRADDPAGVVELPVEDRIPLIHLVIGLPVDVFTASDSLGWCYQFWQAERKDEINAAGNKIGADELPAVTQLFTEDYMVDFLLDNTLGAWHAARVLATDPTLSEAARSEEDLRSAVSLPGCPWKYLRFIKAKDGKWSPAAGAFDGWPKTAKELKCLDPCMGSGHFVVEMFERLVAIRIAEEGLDEAAVVAAVIGQNLFGLEVDPRCTQIGAFNLALAAWRRVGHCTLSAMNLACSGLAPNAKKEDWLRLAGGNGKLQNGMERLYLLFKDAPLLGSLINPRAAADDLLVAAFHELQPLLEKALAQETRDDTVREMVVTAYGLAKAAEILAGQFTLVATNVPYLGRGKQDEVLQDYCKRVHPEAKADLATCFVERCLEFCGRRGSTALVTPQNWLFLGTYRKLRRILLKQVQWDWIARLGPKGFRTPMWDFNIVLFALSGGEPSSERSFAGIDVGSESSPDLKGAALGSQSLVQVLQAGQLGNPDFRIGFESLEGRALLRDFASTGTGMQTFDSPRFLASFWEFVEFGKTWVLGQSTVSETSVVGGRDTAVRWENGKGSLNQLVQDMAAAGYTSGIWKAGSQFWGQRGILVSLMGGIPCTIYDGVPFNNNTGVIIPKDLRHLPAIWMYCSSSEFAKEVRKVDQKVNVTNATLTKIPFDLEHWQKVAAEKYPQGLPKPFSRDPTQWLFDGHPRGSDQPLHAAVARLLGYQWPRQTGSSFLDCLALGPDGLEKLADADGIVCFSATKGEAPAAERLRGLLIQALGKFGVDALIAGAGPKGSNSETLEDWLRDEFFEQHCALFQHRPFVWQIWDGLKNGFNALVNYHKLTHANLEKLTYAHLGDWLRRQQAAVDAGEAGSDARLHAAKQLQSRLKLILDGEPPYDIFVRWKPLSEQAIGWHPDVNDGVRINIRPFATADILRKRVKIKWDKDRGKEPVRDKKEFPWFWGWDEDKQDFAGVGKEPDGNRWNDCHYSNEFKRKARKG